jgi:predicted O-linked N-acetylglucosamine transferase (SPINDLY family)
MPSAFEITERAIALHKQGALDEAARLYQTVLELDPEHFDARHMLGVVSLQQGRVDDAILMISEALRRRPNSADALCDAGFAYQLVRRYDEAIAHYGRALAIRPDDAHAHHHRGIALRALDRVDEAIAHFERALVLQPNLVEALLDLGNALMSARRYEEAIACYEGVLAVDPSNGDAYNNRGNSLAALRRWEEAIASYGNAIALRQDSPEALCNRGNALINLRRHSEAAADFDRALAMQADHVEALHGRGRALRAMGQHEQAWTSFARALSCDPDRKYLLGDAFHSAMHLYDWANFHAGVHQLVDGVAAGHCVSDPFVFLTVSPDPAAQLACAASYVRDRRILTPTPGRSTRGISHERIRLAYLSANYSEHPVTTLIAGLFEAHDRNGFELYGISFGPEGAGKMRSRVKAAFDRFIDVRGLTDVEVAAQMQDLQIDIAIDLTGYTEDARPGILALRPAPIQVNYLGYPGTMGADFIDYILADRFLIPEEHQIHYAERVVYLPDTFQVNDSKRQIDAVTPSREDVGLPAHGLVFCCFNNHYKITPPVFDVWIQILRHTAGSVLWILGGNALSEANLRREAGSRGIDPGRLIFAPRVAYDDHLARYRLADIFLDTLPFNAGTTASDALWAGLPVITCAGEAMAARMAGSLLNAVGLPELVVHSLAAYQSLALRLAADQRLLAEVRHKLARNRDRFPLFDTDRFRRHVESAYQTMWDIHQRGEKPRAFAVAPVER